MSRAIASTITMPAAPLIPCSARKSSSHPIEGATAQAAENTVNDTTPMSSGSRRPKRSLIGPAISCPNPSPSMQTDIVVWARASLTSSDLASSGSTGM